MSVLNIDPAAETQALLEAQLNGFSDQETRDDRVYSMWMTTNLQLSECSDPTQKRVLQIRATVLSSMVTGIGSRALPEDDDPKSHIQSGLDNRGYAIILGYN